MTDTEYFKMANRFHKLSALGGNNPSVEERKLALSRAIEAGRILVTETPDEIIERRILGLTADLWLLGG